MQMCAECLVPNAQSFGSELGEIARARAAWLARSLQRLYNVGIYGAKISRLVFAVCLAFQGRKIFSVLSLCSSKSEYFYEFISPD